MLCPSCGTEHNMEKCPNCKAIAQQATPLSSLSIKQSPPTHSEDLPVCPKLLTCFIVLLALSVLRSLPDLVYNIRLLGLFFNNILTIITFVDIAVGVGILFAFARRLKLFYPLCAASFLIILITVFIVLGSGFSAVSLVPTLVTRTIWSCYFLFSGKTKQYFGVHF